MSSDTVDKIALIVTSSASVSDGPKLLDDNHSMRQDSGVVRTAVAQVVKLIDVDVFTEAMQRQLSTIGSAINRAVVASPLGFPLVEVEVSFAVTATGDIGIASTTAQGTLKLVFRPAPAKPAACEPL